MNIHDEQDEVMRYGADPDSCPGCNESASGRCAFHSWLEEHLASNLRQARELAFSISSIFNIPAPR